MSYSNPAFDLFPPEQKAMFQRRVDSGEISLLILNKEQLEKELTSQNEVTQDQTLGHKEDELIPPVDTARPTEKDDIQYELLYPDSARRRPYPDSLPHGGVRGHGPYETVQYLTHMTGSYHCGRVMEVNYGGDPYSSVVHDTITGNYYVVHINDIKDGIRSS